MAQIDKGKTRRAQGPPSHWIIRKFIGNMGTREGPTLIAVKRTRAIDK